jgi:hypothetical protein
MASFHAPMILSAERPPKSPKLGVGRPCRRRDSLSVIDMDVEVKETG